MKILPDPSHVVPTIEEPSGGGLKSNFLESRWQSKAKEAKPAAAELVTVSKPNKTKLRKKKANSGPKARD